VATDLRVAHTADLDPITLTAARALLYDVFDDMDETDWEHSLGGIHALVVENGEQVIGHAAVVQRRLLYRGQALRTGYVEGVAVRTDRRGYGHGAVMMAALERVIRGAYDLGALGASDLATTFYAHRGWTPWAGPTWAFTPDGIVRTPDEDDGIFVLPVTTEIDPTSPLTCDWRDGDVW
jgi:aminoglycoside 2'-N-acetyltransferase I